MNWNKKSVHIQTLKALWVILVIAHLVVIFTNVASFFALIVYAPWYVAMPCCTMIVRVLFTVTRCPLTTLENSIRDKLGKPRIDRFVEYYIIRTLWNGRKNNDPNELRN